MKMKNKFNMGGRGGRNKVVERSEGVLEFIDRNDSMYNIDSVLTLEKFNKFYKEIFK